MKLNKIATLAHGGKKPNQRAAQKLIFNVIRGEELDDRELVLLYNFFQPAAPKTPKTNIDWVYKAVAKLGARPYLNLAYSDGIRLIGCDGHRVHVVDGVGIEAGFYDQNMVKIALEATFPAIDRVLGTEVDILDPFSLSDYPKVDSEGQSCTMVGEHAFLTKYVQDAVCGLGDGVLMGLDGPKLFLQNKDRLVVVMAIRV